MMRWMFQDRWQMAVRGLLVGTMVTAMALPVFADEYNVKYTYDTSTNKVLTNVGSGSDFPDAVVGRPRGQSTYMQKAKARQQAAAKKKKAEQNKLAKEKAAKEEAARQAALESAEIAAPSNTSSSNLWVPPTTGISTFQLDNQPSAKTAKKSPTTAKKPKTSKPAKAAKSPTAVAKASPSRTVVNSSGGNLKIHTVDDSILPAPKVEYDDMQRYAYAGETWAFATYDESKRSPRLVRYYGWHTDSKTGQKVNGWYDIDLNPLILEAAKATGVDPLLVEIIIRHESNFNPYARSPVGAVGLMQLMPYTAGGLGISDVYDVRDNIRGGAQYIAYQLERFHSVPLALAAYNAGPGAVLEYGGVPPYSETQYYVRTIYGEYQEALRYRQAHR